MIQASTPGHSPFRGRWLWATVAVALLCVLFITLGFWQLDRLAQKRAANARILARMEEPPLLLDGGVLDPDAADLRRGAVRGTYDFSQEVVLRNRARNDLPGVHVIVPLRIAGSDAAVLVDRGWIPYELSAPEQRRQFQDAAGEVEVRGILRRSEVRASAFSPADAPLSASQPRLDAWHRVDIPRIQEQMPYPLLALFLEEEPTAGVPARRFPRPEPDIVLSEGRHLGYALQWFAFTAILSGGYLTVFRQRAGRAEYANRGRTT